MTDLEFSRIVRIYSRSILEAVCVIYQHGTDDLFEMKVLRVAEPLVDFFNSAEKNLFGSLSDFIKYFDENLPSYTFVFKF